jgi:SMI1 / KNR4 family (SUKH-1)
MNLVARILSQIERNWNGSLPATDLEIEQLLSSTKIDLPQEFLDLLKFSNGGEGDIALPPLIFQLYKIQEIIELAKDEFYQEYFPNFLFFGGNRGLEMTAFDLRTKLYPIVMIDSISGEESAIETAPTIVEFINAIGLEYKENART